MIFGLTFKSLGARSINLAIVCSLKNIRELLYDNRVLFSSHWLGESSITYNQIELLGIIIKWNDFIKTHV